MEGRLRKYTPQTIIFNKMWFYRGELLLLTETGFIFGGVIDHHVEIGILRKRMVI